MRPSVWDREDGSSHWSSVDIESELNLRQPSSALELKELITHLKILAESAVNHPSSQCGLLCKDEVHHSLLCLL